MPGIFQKRFGKLSGIATYVRIEIPVIVFAYPITWYEKLVYSVSVLYSSVNDSTALLPY